MRDRYSALSGDSEVFRTVSVGGVFLPPGHDLPLPAWLEPSSDDEAEAQSTGRLVGLSVWDRSLTNFTKACAWRRVDEASERAFSASVASIRQAGAAHGRAVDVVADPLDTGMSEYASLLESLSAVERDSQRRSAEGHSLIEGIKRPPGTPKSEHRAFRDKLAGEFHAL